MITGLNWVDWGILGLIILSTCVGMLRGFVREALSLIVWALAFWVAYTFANSIASDLLSKHITHPNIRYGISFAGLFIITLIAGGIVNHLIATAVKKTGLGGTDRILGIVFGFLRGIVIIAVMLLFVALTPATQEKWYKNSSLVPHFSWLTQWLRHLLPPTVQARLQPYGTQEEIGTPVIVSDADDNKTKVIATPTPENTDIKPSATDTQAAPNAVKENVPPPPPVTDEKSMDEAAFDPKTRAPEPTAQVPDDEGDAGDMNQ